MATMEITVDDATGKACRDLRDLCDREPVSAARSFEDHPENLRRLITVERDAKGAFQVRPSEFLQGVLAALDAASRAGE